jgi:radical SAM-linked protein
MRNTLIVKFSIQGDVRFLSHQEMLRMFGRALIRAEIPLSFSEGFNPHPRISLPLPRSVGIESDDELICIGIECDESEHLVKLADTLKERLGSQLPDGLAVTKAKILKGRESLHADGAKYIFRCTAEELLNTVKAKTGEILSKKNSGEQVLIKRCDEKGYCRQIEAGQYIEGTNFLKSGFEIEYKITQQGSIRIEELIQLFDIDVAKLSEPIKRTAVKWNTNIFSEV